MTLIERALIHNPELLYPLSAPLAAAYSHLGRDQEARAALDNYKKEWPWAPAWANLQRVMTFFPFKNPEVADRLAHGLLKAGLGGKPSGYYKVSEERKLTGEEIKALVFDRTISGFTPINGIEWKVYRTKDGKATYRQSWSAQKFHEPVWSSDSGTSRIQGDMIWDQWQKRLQGLKHCMTVFRNPEGKPEMKNEYLAISDFGIHPFSPVD